MGFEARAPGAPDARPLASNGAIPDDHLPQCRVTTALDQNDGPCFLPDSLKQGAGHPEVDHVGFAPAEVFALELGRDERLVHVQGGVSVSRATVT